MKLKPSYLFVLATLLAFALAFYRLGHAPFWLDEFVAWHGAHLPFSEIWQRATSQYHPPLHFWLMHGWLKIVPHADEFWLRLPSALFFALTVPMVFLVGRTLGGSSRAGAYAALLAATAPFLLHYGQEARPYAILTFFAACGFAATAYFVSRCKDEARPRLIGAGLFDAIRLFVRGDFRTSWRALGDDGAWMVYILSSVIVMWLHNTAGIYPMVTGIILLCAIWLSPSFRGFRFANLCIAAVIIAVLYSPQIPHLLSGVEQISLFYVDIPNVHGIIRIFQVVYGGGYYLPLILLTTFVITAVVVWTRNGRDERAAFALLGWLLAPIIFIIFSFWKPILQPKLLIWTLVPFLAAGGAGLALVPWRLVRAVLLSVLLVFHFQGIAREWKSVKQDWSSASRIISQNASPDAAMIVCPGWYRHIFSHYWKREGRPDLRLHLVNNHRQIFEVRPDNRKGLQVQPAKLFERYPEVWVITPSCNGRLDFLTTTLEAQGRLIKKWKPSGIRIRQYGR